MLLIAIVVLIVVLLVAGYIWIDQETGFFRWEKKAD